MDNNETERKNNEMNKSNLFYDDIASLVVIIGGILVLVLL